jgi:hypothetical protein
VLPLELLFAMGGEAFALDRDLLNLDSAIEEATRRHAAACANQAAAEERDSAQQARERFSKFAQPRRRHRFSAGGPEKKRTSKRLPPKWNALLSGAYEV